MSLSVGLMQLGHAASLRPAWRRFAASASDPATAQRARFRSVLETTRLSARGFDLGLSKVDTIAGFQNRVPMARYADLAAWVDRVAEGENGVLTAEPVRMLEPTSGSTSAYKLIPYTQGLFDEFSEAISPWLYDLYRRNPGLVGTRSYWSVSPPARRPAETAGGVSIGLPSDTAYFGSLGRLALSRMMAVPDDVGQIGDIDEWRHATCRHLLASSDLGLISVWSPTFLTLLMRHIEEHLGALTEHLSARRRRQIRRGVDKAGRVTGEALWPRLRLISCWTDGTSRSFADQLAHWFVNTPLQGKGLMATEGALSFPVTGCPGAVLAVNSHFMEFIDLERPDARPLLAHQLRVGGHYAPLISTSGGLLRYDLGDVVTCVGYFRATPCIRFVGRRDQTSDLCGEKLGVPQVEDAIERASRELGITSDFALLAPVTGEPPAYALFLEATADSAAFEQFAAVVEAALCEGYHYAACRRLGQLGPVRAVPVQGAWDLWVRRIVDEGRRLGDLKPCALDIRNDWSETFGVGDQASRHLA
jgi:hypothetical protein